MAVQLLKEIFAKRLENVRKSKGWTQARLAEETEGLTKSAIEKFEKAEMGPTPLTLSRLAETLNVMPEDLVRPFIVDINYSKVRYRKRSKMSKKVVERLQRIYGLKLERYIEIEKITESEVPFTMDYSDIIVRTKADARRVARRFRADMGWGTRPVISPIRQLEMKGVKVFILDETESANKDFDGMCYSENGYAVVILKKGECTERDRLTLFHEIAHLLMNIEKGIEGRELEKLCDAFASEVLFPESEFRKHIWPGCRIYPATLKMLQREWGISCAAMMYKAKELGIINENRHIGYMVRLNRDKVLKKEMEASIFPAETTNRFETLVYKALGEYKISTVKAAAMLGKSVEELNKINDLANV